MATEEEKKIARAYNIGSILSTYEPKLLEQIIKSNKQNEFVQVMEAARDHNEFVQGIPRKDFTPQYKNGYKNARALSLQDPRLLDKLITDKNLNKDFIKGLEAGKKEMKIKQTMSRMKQERDQQQRSIDKDLGLDI